jgi:hypothetical protein
MGFKEKQAGTEAIKENLLTGNNLDCNKMLFACNRMQQY